MVEHIQATEPGLNLGLRNFTREMAAHSSCRGWFTFEAGCLTQDAGGRIRKVMPRIGNAPLAPPDHGEGPRFTDELPPFSGARFTRRELDYLSVPVSLPTGDFTLVAVVVVAELFPNALTLMAVSQSRRFLRIGADNEGFVLKCAPWEERAPVSSLAPRQTALVAMSFSGENVRAAVWAPGTIPTDVATLQQAIRPFDGSADAVLGADCVGDSPDASTPSAPRSWDGGVHDFWIFDRDLLEKPEDSAELSVIRDYTAAVFGEPSRPEPVKASDS